MGKDALPRNDEKLLGFNKNLIGFLGDRLAGDPPEWPVPPAALENLSARYEDFKEKVLAYRIDENPGKCRAKNDSKDALRKADRVFLNNYIRKRSYVSNTAYVMLWLPVPKVGRSRKPVPQGQAAGHVFNPGTGLVDVSLFMLNEQLFEKDDTLRFHLYYGFMPYGGATLEQAAGPGRYLMKPPVSGAELPFDVPSFMPRKKRIDLGTDHSGMTVFFAVRLENAKGEQGPWGPLFSAVVT